MKHNTMSRYELSRRLKRLKSDYEDLQETISFHFNYTSAHISSKKVKKDEELLEDIKQEICSIEALLSENGTRAEHS